MLDAFVSLVTIAGTIGKVTAASLYPSGLVVIDVEEKGTLHTLTYSSVPTEDRNEDS